MRKFFSAAALAFTLLSMAPLARAAGDGNIAVEALPVDVMTGFKGRFPGGEPKTAKVVTQGNAKVYVLTLDNKGVATTITLGADGTVLKVDPAK